MMSARPKKIGMSPPHPREFIRDEILAFPPSISQIDHGVVLHAARQLGIDVA